MNPEDRESNAVATLDPGPDKVIGPGHDYGSVTDEIGGVVFRPFLKTPKQMFIGFACAFLLVNLLLVAVTWLFVRGVGIWGIVIPIAWGFAIVNFVWWIGIGHAGTLISAILLLLEAGLANLHQSVFGSDDAIRGRVRRHVSDPAPGAAVARILADSLSQHHVAVAATPQPSDLGCVRGLDLRDRLLHLLVHGVDSGLRHHAR
jgi:hypothetical protein